MCKKIYEIEPHFRLKLKDFIKLFCLTMVYVSKSNKHSSLSRSCEKTRFIRFGANFVRTTEEMWANVIKLFPL